MALTMTHQEISVFVRLVLMECQFPTTGGKRAKEPLELVVRFKNHHWVEVIIFLPSLMTALDTYGCTS